jgi:tetratricopeptide (TPR) repeat protein
MNVHATKRTFFALLVALACSLGSFPVGAQTPAANQPTPEADALFQAQKWDEAAKAYEAVTRQQPGNGRAWYRLAYSLHALGKYEDAIAAYQKNLGINSANANAMYNLACAFARSNNKDKAFEWLGKAAAAGFPPRPTTLDTDNDLDSLRGDARFQEVKQNLVRAVTPCMAAPEYRQFDFWVGEWDVFTPQGQKAGTSSIQRVSGGCLILENWTSAGGGDGKSFNYYNPADKKWHQLWIGTAGGVLDLAGEYKDNALRYSGESAGPNGTRVFNRLTFFNLGEKVRQFWETSADGGKTWTVAFDGMYVKKK